jgi:uncharacterized protein
MTMLWLVIALLLTTLAALTCARLESRKVRHRRVELFFDTLPEAFDGYTILYLSDPHFGKHDERKARVLANLAAEPVDLCVITGDLIERDEGVFCCQDALRTLKARDGVFYVLGNHDYFQYSLRDAFHDINLTNRRNDVDRLIRVLEHTGLRLLRNENVPLRRQGAALWLAGVDDPVTRRDDVTRTFAGMPREAFAILLAHTPDVLNGFSRPGEHLVLAGHTHGGQILLPLWGPLKNHSKLKPGFVSGRLDLGNRVLLVSNGLGVNRNFPYRFRCRAEVLTVCLRKRRSGTGVPQPDREIPDREELSR